MRLAAINHTTGFRFDHGNCSQVEVNKVITALSDNREPNHYLSIFVSEGNGPLLPKPRSRRRPNDLT